MGRGLPADELGADSVRDVAPDALINDRGIAGESGRAEKYGTSGHLVDSGKQGAVAGMVPPGGAGVAHGGDATSSSSSSSASSSDLEGAQASNTVDGTTAAGTTTGKKQKKKKGFVGKVKAKLANM